VSLHVLPPSTHRYTDNQTVVVTQQFLGIDASEIHDKAIFLRAAYLIDGRLEITDGGAPVAARLRFTDHESIAGTPIEVNVESDEGGRFQARLTHGLYDVEIIPKDGKHPPHRISKLKVDKDGPLVLSIPLDENYPRLTGRIVTPDTTARPIAGVRVQVFSAADKQISGAVTTDDKGVFRVWLSAKERQRFRALTPRSMASSERLPSSEKSPRRTVSFSRSMMVNAGSDDLILTTTM